MENNLFVSHFSSFSRLRQCVTVRLSCAVFLCWFVVVTIVTRITKVHSVWHSLRTKPDQMQQCSSEHVPHSLFYTYRHVVFEMLLLSKALQTVMSESNVAMRVSICIHRAILSTSLIRKTLMQAYSYWTHFSQFDLDKPNRDIAYPGITES